MLEMQLRPPAREPVVDVAGAAVVIQVEVEGRAACAHVSRDALVAHCGAGADPRTWLRAYRAHAALVNRVAIRKLRAGDAGTILSSDFRR